MQTDYASSPVSYGTHVYVELQVWEVPWTSKTRCSTRCSRWSGDGSRSAEERSVLLVGFADLHERGETAGGAASPGIRPERRIHRTRRHPVGPRDEVRVDRERGGDLGVCQAPSRRRPTTAALSSVGGLSRSFRAASVRSPTLSADPLYHRLL
jgi:hypothetical protein